MEKSKQELLNILQELTEDKFNKFKWHLGCFSAIPKAELEKATWTQTVDLMVQKYPGPEGLELTMKVLETINRNDLVLHLKNSHSEPKDLKTHSGAQKQENTREKPNLKSAQQFAVEVTLDHNTAHPNLILSADGKRVRHGDVRKDLPNKAERFYSYVNVLGQQSFSENFYFEVQVKGKTDWDLGVAKESIQRRKKITTSPENGYWTIMLRKGNQYEARDDEGPEGLCMNQPPEKVGVFVDYEEGLVCFYDVDTADLLYCFSGCSFTEKLYPFFSPCTNKGGTNSAPLIISPVNHTD